MGECRHDLIKPGSAGDRKPGPGCADRSCKRGTTARLALLIVLLAAGAGAAGAAGPVATEVWESENLELDARGSVQVTIGYGQIPVRRWTLVVDGADRNCDLNVRRVRDGSLLYQETDGRRHMVSVPWGEGEQISLVVTNRDAPAVFVLSLVGPPRDQVHAAYSYHVNRALEKYADGQRLDAESECRDALAEDPDDHDDSPCSTASGVVSSARISPLGGASIASGCSGYTSPLATRLVAAPVVRGTKTGASRRPGTRTTTRPSPSQSSA